MKISPVTAPAAPAAQGPSNHPMRTIRMSPNVTPGREAPAEAPADPSISDPNREASATDEATQPLSPQYAALAKHRRALQAKEREIQDKLKELETRTATQAGGIDVARIKSDPLGVLLESGVTYEQLTEAILSNQDQGPVNALKAEIQALKGELDKRFTDRDAQAEQQVLAEMKKEASALIAEGDEFELVRANNSIPIVMNLIEQTYRKTGEVLDVREALSLVEKEHLEDLERLKELKKVRERFAPTPPQPATQQQRPMTLTNRDTATAPMSARQRAIAAFQGTLKR